MVSQSGIDSQLVDQAGLNPHELFASVGALETLTEQGAMSTLSLGRRAILDAGNQELLRIACQVINYANSRIADLEHPLVRELRQNIDGVQQETVGLDLILEISNSENIRPSKIEDRYKDVRDRANVYVNARTLVDQEVTRLQKYGIKVKAQKESEKYSGHAYQLRDSEHQMTASEVLIARLKEGDLVLPKRLHEVISIGFGVKTPDTRYEIGNIQDPEIQPVIRLLDSLGMMSKVDYGSSRIFAADSNMLSWGKQGIFSNNAQYDAFKQELYQLSVAGTGTPKSPSV